MPAKKTAVKRRRKRTKNFSYVLYILYVLVLLVLIGTIVGSGLFSRLDQGSRALLADHASVSLESFDADTWSFNQLFFRQFMYQGSIWVLGLSVIGILANLFLVFFRGVVAGLNLLFIFDTLGLAAGFLPAFLWLVQFSLVLCVTILSGYFSIRFVLVAAKILLIKKSTAQFQKHLLYYFYQLFIIMVLTLLSSGVTYLIQPLVFAQLSQASAISSYPPENPNVIVVE